LHHTCCTQYRPHISLEALSDKGFTLQRPEAPPENRRHSGIGLHTPADVHYGLAETATQRRVQTLAEARAATPHRFSSNADPKILELPEAAWINPPVTHTEDQEQEPATAAA